MPTKPNWKTADVRANGTVFHYYAVSVASWKTGTNLDKLIAQMKKEGFEFVIYIVYKPHDSSYPIRNYVPDLPQEEFDFIAKYEKVS